MDESDDVLSKLSVLEKRFCEAYAGDANGNGVKACQMAGYSGEYGTLATNAYRLLRKPAIKEYLNSLTESDPLVASRAERLRFLTRVVRGEEMEKRLVRMDTDSVWESCEPSLRDRLAAQEALSKLAGEQVAKHALTNSAGEDVDLAKLPIGEVFAIAAMSSKGGE